MSASRGVVAAAVLVSAVGVAIRLNNSVLFPTNWGFDAPDNWHYIQLLLDSWALPAPDADWATSHPPLFYYACAALCRALGLRDEFVAVLVLRLFSTLLGLLSILLAVMLVRRCDPARPVRALVAAGLLLFLPVHIYMSAMLNEEIMAATLVSLAVVGVSLSLAGPGSSRRAVLQASLSGLFAGLALLTKLSGALVIGAATCAYALDGLRRRAIRPALGCTLAFAGLATLVGGWYYAHSFVRYGYFYPQNLQVHEIMFGMPPGERRAGDYFRVPLATWTDPQVLAPDLQRSVPGSTYVSMWFDGHRHFLPREGEGVRRIGTAILLLALLPTTAFAVGFSRGVARAVRVPRGPDTPLVLLVVFTFAGYALFTWRNPWFASVKASYLLGLSVPFAYYASEVLADWTATDGRATNWTPREWTAADRAAGDRTGGGWTAGGLLGALVWACLATLALAVTATFSYGWLFFKTQAPGLPWEGMPTG